MHSLCAGMLPQQFVSFCNFAGIGQTKKHYIHAVSSCFMIISIGVSSHSVLNSQVHECSKWHSREHAIERVKALPDYATEWYFIFLISIYQVTWLMLAMTQFSMGTTQLILVSLAGINTYDHIHSVLSTCRNCWSTHTTSIGTD